MRAMLLLVVAADVVEVDGSLAPVMTVTFFLSRRPSVSPAEMQYFKF